MGIDSRTKNLRPAPRWQPGQSGNPKGRPPGSQSITTHLKALLERSIAAPRSEFLDKSERKITGSQLIALKLLTKAAAGDLQAIRETLDRLEGKPREIVEQFTPTIPDWITDRFRPIGNEENPV